MKKFILYFILVATFLANINLKAQFDPDSLHAKINAVVKKYVDSNKAALMVGVIRKEGNSNPVEYKYSFGHIRADTSTPRPDSLTIFQLGSVTKSFTATILSMLIQQGGPLSLNDLVENHLPLNLVRAPVFVNPGGDTVRMLILDLATHYSALPDDPIIPVHDTTTYQMMYDYLNSKTLTRAPGQCYLYSNLGVSLLGVVVTNTLGNIIDSLFIQKICDPLDMPDTRISLTQQQMLRRAQGYKFGTTEGPFHKGSWPAFDAAGGLYTTLTDFLKYLKFQMGLTNPSMQSVLDSAQRIRRKADTDCSDPNSTGRVGLVWQMNILNEHLDSTFYFTWKNGGTASFSSFICFAHNTSKNLKTGVVVLSNHLSPSCDNLGVQILRYLNSDTTSVGISVNQISNTIPQSFKLYQNYPNPFNPVTKIKFDVATNVRGQSSKLKLVIYDAAGKEIVTLAEGEFDAGTYEVKFDGTNSPSGVYFYKLTYGNYSETKKLFFIK